jgi:hypothetical protein
LDDASSEARGRAPTPAGVVLPRPEGSDVPDLHEARETRLRGHEGGVRARKAAAPREACREGAPSGMPQALPVDEGEGPLRDVDDLRHQPMTEKNITIVTDDGTPVTLEHIRIVGMYLEAGRPVEDANVALMHCVPPARVFRGEPAQA